MANSIEIEIKGIKPLSMNNVFATTRSGRRVKTKRYNEFEQEINVSLSRYILKLQTFSAHYNDNEHYVNASYVFYYPIMTKPKNKSDKSRISKTSMDASNIIKTIEDILFKKLGIDDSQVLSVSSTKVHSKDVRMVITLSRGELQSLP